MSAHYSINLFEEDGTGWWPGLCACGWNGGLFPDAEDAADALMDHAYQAGYALAQASPVSPKGKHE